MPLEQTLKGVYDHSIFCNEEAGWTVGVLKTPDRRDMVTVVGAFTALPGETLSLKGNWIHNRKFGEQFEVKEFKAEMPASLDGLRKYLGSGMIKGIGKVYADRLIARFGLEVPRIIEEVPRRLREVEGIGQGRQAKIVEGWNAQKAIKNIMVFLQGHGVGTAFAVKIYKKYGDEAIAKVQENPYRLANEIHGIGFKTADGIAAHMGIEKNSPVRAQAGVLYLLKELSERRGHVFYPRGPLITEVTELLQGEEGVVAAALVGLTGELGSPLICEKAESAGEDAIFLRALHEAEKSSATMLTHIKNTPAPKLRPIQWDKFFEWYLEKKGIEFAPIQKQAIQTAYDGKVTVVTGGPGTGKSTLIQALTSLFTSLHLPFLLAAPTGRAAKRMTEVTGAEAKTIHRLLEFEPKSWSFRRNRENPLDCDLLIIDEMSMIDTQLFQKLLQAVPATSRLVMVGDIDQLPSVGAGNILGDIIASGEFPTVRLTEIYRQAAHSQIIRNAHRINRGESPIDQSAEKSDAQDFFYFEKDDPDQCVNLLKDICLERIPKKFGFHSLKDIQVLVPMNRGVVGTKNLNVELQKVLNRNSVFLERGSRRYVVGDRVIQIRNNYDLEVYNGDIGFIEAIDLEEKMVSVRFDQKIVVYESSDLDELELAYAISIHKSQGSEFPVVVIPLLTQHAVMLQRNLLYTAVTRGKKLVVLVGSRKAVSLAVRNADRGRRYTKLAERLRVPILN